MNTITDLQQPGSPGDPAQRPIGDGDGDGNALGYESALPFLLSAPSIPEARPSWPATAAR